MAERIGQETDADLMKEFMRISMAEIREGELTVTMFMEFMDIKRKRAEYLLTKYTGLGFLHARRIIERGKPVNAFSPNNCTWKDVIDKVKKLQE